MMGIMMENGEVINWDSFCASLCQPHLSKTCNEKWWAPAVHQILFPSPSLFSTSITGLAIKKRGKKEPPKPKRQRPVPSSSTAVIGQPALHFPCVRVCEGDVPIWSQSSAMVSLDLAVSIRRGFWVKGMGNWNEHNMEADCASGIGALQRVQ